MSTHYVPSDEKLAQLTAAMQHIVTRLMALEMRGNRALANIRAAIRSGDEQAFSVGMRVATDIIGRTPEPLKPINELVPPGFCWQVWGALHAGLALADPPAATTARYRRFGE